MNDELNILKHEAVKLLKEIIQIPSFSREEENVVEVLSKYLQSKNILTEKIGNNLIAKNKYFDNSLQSIVLNSHTDTVHPNKSYTLNPFEPIERDGKIFGLGSNDAGGSLVSLLITFIYFYEKESLKFNLIFIASAEEEISGKNGIELLLPQLNNLFCAIVGEPTGMQLAIAERGLLVLDCVSKGKPGHAAREEGINAIYNAINDINWIKNYQFPKISDLLGSVKLNVTVIDTLNKSHNIIPDECRFVVDCRVNEFYTFNEIIETIQKNINAKITPRSLRICSTIISTEHPLVVAGKNLGRSVYGSPTSSDKSLMPCPTLKLGPGLSERSHTADEFIFKNEIFEGIELYIKIINQLL